MLYTKRIINVDSSPKVCYKTFYIFNLHISIRKNIQVQKITIDQSKRQALICKKKNDKIEGFNK